MTLQLNPEIDPEVYINDPSTLGDLSKPVAFADDPQFWFETLRTIGHAAYCGADIGEVLTTAQRIVAGDYDSWHDEWLALADRTAGEAEPQLAAGHRISARDGLLRASNYYRAAEFFLHGTGPTRASTTPSAATRSASGTPRRCSLPWSSWWRSLTSTLSFTVPSTAPRQRRRQRRASDDGPAQRLRRRR